MITRRGWCHIGIAQGHPGTVSRNLLVSWVEVLLSTNDVDARRPDREGFSSTACDRSDMKCHLVVSQNKGTPISTPIYYSPYYWDPQNGTPNFGKP